MISLQNSHISLRLFIGCMAMMLGLCLSMPVSASLTSQTVTGTVDRAEEATQAWESLAAAQAVDPGYLVRTDFGAKTDLKGDDGSLIFVDEATQLAIREFEFNPDQQIRIAKFAIIEGTVTAEAAHLEYATNVFDVETPTVTASFKYSKAKFAVDKTGNTVVTIYSGIFDIKYRGDSKGAARMKYTTPDGVTIDVPMSEGGAVAIEITPKGMNFGNIGKTPITAVIAGKSVELTPNATIGMTTEGGQPVIKNTSSTEGGEVKVGGVLIEPNGTLTLTQTGIQQSGRPLPQQTRQTGIAGASGMTGLTNPFQDVNRSNTSSSLPASGDGTTAIQPAGQRQEQVETVIVPVEVTN